MYLYQLLLFCLSVDCHTQGADLYYKDGVSKCIYFGTTAVPIDKFYRDVRYCVDNFGSSAKLPTVEDSDEILWSLITSKVTELAYSLL